MNGRSLTYFQEKTDEEYYKTVGLVRLSSGKELKLCYFSRFNNSVNIITIAPHGVPIQATDHVDVVIAGNSIFGVDATAIDEMTLFYSETGSDEKSDIIGTAVLTNGKAILLDYNIDSWDISHNLFYHYGILIDDEMKALNPNNLGPSIFKDNRVISLPGVNFKIQKNNKIQFV